MENREKIFVANFKELGLMAQVLDKWVNYFVEHRKLLSLKNKIIVAPPTLGIMYMNEKLRSKHLSITMAAQEVSAYEEGNYTGETSAKSLVEEGVKYVIVGHSETRILRHLTDAEVWKEAQQAQSHHLTPIVCVENIKQAAFSINDPDFDGIIAYEPTYAIGTGVPIRLNDVEKTCGDIKRLYPKARILYGGSVLDKNVKDIINIPNIDGVLVGRLSANPEFFGKIIQEVSN